MPLQPQPYSARMTHLSSVVTCDVSAVCAAAAPSSSFTLTNSYVPCDGHFSSLRGGDTSDPPLWGPRHLPVRDEVGGGAEQTQEEPWRGCCVFPGREEGDLDPGG